MSDLVVRHVVVPLPHWLAELDGFRLLHLSDLHVRAWNRTLDRLRRTLFELEYDLLLMTGDFSHVPRQYDAVYQHLRRLLGGLSPRWGTYGTFGNHDSPQLGPLLLDLGVRMLSNEVTTVRVNSEPSNWPDSSRSNTPPAMRFPPWPVFPPTGRRF